MSTPSPYGSWLLGGADQSRRALRVRVQLLLTTVLVATNVIGALVVGSVLLLVRPDEPLEGGLLLAMAIALPVYVGLAVLLGATLITHRVLRALQWAREGRAPDEAERRRAVQVPRYVTARQAGLWFLGTCLFTGLSLLLQPSLALTVGVAVGIAGVVVCAIAYLLTEFVLRPVTARALAYGVPSTGRGSGVRRRMITFWLLGTAVPVSGLLLVAILALAGDEQVSRTRLAVVVLVLGGVVLLFGLLITGLDARAVVSPLTSVRTALGEVEAGRFDVEIPVYDATELGLLQAGFNRMAAGLRERERIRDLFGRHVGLDVAEAALGRDVALGGETRTVSVLFVDLMGSTTLATERSAADVVDLLNRFCGVVIDEVDRHGGLVNKFMGDAVLAIFGAPVERSTHAGDALRAARAVADRLAAELPEIRAGVGVATGEAVAGNVGDERRFEYTVIGDAVNQAARLTELAKRRPGLLLVSCVSVEAADAEEAARWQPAGAEVLRGRADPTPLAVPVGSEPASVGDGTDDQASETSSA